MTRAKPPLTLEHGWDISSGDATSDPRLAGNCQYALGAAALGSIDLGLGVLASLSSRAARS